MSGLLNRVKKLEEMIAASSKEYVFHVMTKEKMREGWLSNDTIYNDNDNHVVMYI